MAEVARRAMLRFYASGAAPREVLIFYPNADHLRRTMDKEVSWPCEVSEEDKAKLLLEQASHTKKRFGNLQERKKLPPQISEKELVDRKLREGRAFFDSADYFRALQGVRDVPMVAALPSCIFVFKRDESGALVRNQTEPFSETLMQQLVTPPKGAYFDSADWSLSLHGLLVYPK